MLPYFFLPVGFRVVCSLRTEWTYRCLSLEPLVLFASLIIDNFFHSISSLKIFLWCRLQPFMSVIYYHEGHIWLAYICRFGCEMWGNHVLNFQNSGGTNCCFFRYSHKRWWKIQHCLRDDVR